MPRSRVALFLRSIENDYQQGLRADALVTAERLGLELKVESAQNDAARQSAQIRAAVRGPDAATLAAVLVSPVVDEALAEVAAAAVQAGVGWAVLLREAEYLGALREQAPALAVFGVAPDQTEIGRVQGRQAAALLPEGGPVLCVTGPGGTSSARRRREGLAAELGAGAGRLAVTYVEADWTSEGARLALDRWLEGEGRDAPTPGLACAQNDDMALGVRQALRDAASRREDAALARIPITGCDGTPGFGQRLVRANRLAATVVVPSAAGPALEWIARAAAPDGERPPARVELAVGSFPAIDALRP